MQCLEFCAVDSIKKSATLKSDFMMLSCKTWYFLKDIIIKVVIVYTKSPEFINLNESQSSGGTNLYKDVECEALREIVKEYYEQIIEVLEVWKCIFTSKDIIMRDSTRKCLQRNLEKVNIIIFQNIEDNRFVYSTSLTTEQLVILYVNTKTELHQL